MQGGRHQPHPLSCLLSADVRARFPSLFLPTASTHPAAPLATVHELMKRPAERLKQMTSFVAACRARGRHAAGLPP